MREFIRLIEAASGFEAPDNAAWFAGSKIFDDEGKPLVVHHFTYNEFTEFDRLWAARYFKRDPEGIDTLGSWFTTNPKANYVNKDWGGRRMDVILSMKRPFYVDDVEEGDSFLQLLAKVKEAGGSSNLRDQLKQKGYDGIILLGTFLDGVTQTVLIAFEPSQIRPAPAPPVDEIPAEEAP